MLRMVSDQIPDVERPFPLYQRAIPRRVAEIAGDCNAPFVVSPVPARTITR